MPLSQAQKDFLEQITIDEVLDIAGGNDDFGRGDEDRPFLPYFLAINNAVSFEAPELPNEEVYNQEAVFARSRFFVNSIKEVFTYLVDKFKDHDQARENGRLDAPNLINIFFSSDHSPIDDFFSLRQIFETNNFDNFKDLINQTIIVHQGDANETTIMDVLFYKTLCKHTGDGGYFRDLCDFAAEKYGFEEIKQRLESEEDYENAALNLNEEMAINRFCVVFSSVEDRPEEIGWLEGFYNRFKPLFEKSEGLQECYDNAFIMRNNADLLKEQRRESEDDRGSDQGGSASEQEWEQPYVGGTKREGGDYENNPRRRRVDVGLDLNDDAVIPSEAASPNNISPLQDPNERGGRL